MCVHDMVHVITSLLSTLSFYFCVACSTKTQRKAGNVYHMMCATTDRLDLNALHKGSVHTILIAYRKTAIKV